MESKFKGCLLGALLGDCFGKPFEYVSTSPLDVKEVQSLFENVKEGTLEDKLRYTDDTAMTKVLATSLIEKKGVDVEDLAYKFSDEFFKDDDRDYGKNVRKVFFVIHDLQKQGSSSADDVLQPARKQFKGKGSFGNGAAMRIGPVALFHYDNIDAMIEAARNSALVTHANKKGYNGAILQCLAIQQALQEDPKLHLEPVDFINKLKTKMLEVEKTDETQEYCNLLDKMKVLLTKSPTPAIEEVISELGNRVSATKSVPTAIFSFLLAQKPINEITAENPFERTIRYAIGLGGDTDTIACMAGAICGAYVGVDGIPSQLIPPCEDNETIACLAEQLYQITITNDTSAATT